ncbi:response regulator transcription factor [Dyadobacter sp. LHD-138]|uniref:response regulator transcription factor n=1 Tax=Dyadobacter sp. LHD-138 TaxID=3071413 RepID=UPI0027E12D92|nr:response regulator transcription factor [Dyadobacter sp. LHD-138]MDQ6480542.1 response regulator transcription factor [Dyadobacter sp. LHD-138]
MEMFPQARQMQTAVIYEDHLFFGQAFSELLKSTGLFDDVHYFSSEKQLIEYCKVSRSGEICLFLDFFIGRGNSLHLLSDLRKLPVDIRIVIVSSVDNAVLVKKILHQKVDGFLSKIDDINEVKECIAALSDKGTYISPAIKELLINEEIQNENKELTTREIEIVSWLSAGQSTAQIAEQLNLSIHTVMTHRKNIMIKIGANSISQAIVYAIRAGLIENR